MTRRNIVAIDLGASSGRVMLARWDATQRKLALQEVRRFKNRRQRRAGYDCWDLAMLEHEIRSGLAQLEEEGIVPDSIGIDTWGVDMVLLDAQGEPVGEAVSYRDARTHGLMDQAQQELSRRAIYAQTGIQFLPFNTLYQMRALQQ